MTIATETRLSAQNCFFSFFSEKISKKVANRSFLAFWPFENEQKFRRKRKNAAKNLKFSKKWILSSQTPWNLRMYHHDTSYYADHRFLIINTNRFIIHRCEYYLFLNRTVLFICFITNLSPMWKLSFFPTLWNYNFIASTIANVKRTVFTNHNNHLVTSQNKLQKNHAHSISILRCMKEILPNFQ